jgi:hypothetical protein
MGRASCVLMYNLSVTKTMYWRVVPDAIMIVVHTDQTPSDEEWDTYLAEVIERARELRGVLVYSESAGPSAPQRARSNEAYKAAGVQMRTAIMSSSRLVRGVVTALSWTLADKVKSFSTKEFDPAAKYLGLSKEDQLKARVVLKQLARSAGVEIEAFADESGQFNRKYN